MNKEITFINGNTIVEDEKGNKKEIENSTNLNDILIQENIVESLDNKEMQLNEDISNKQKKINESKKGSKSLGYIYIIMSILTPLISYMLFDYIGGSKAILENLGNLSFTELMTIFLSSIEIIGMGIVYKEEKDNTKTLEKELSGLETELEYVRKDLELQREQLNKLNEEKTLIDNSDSKELRIEKVNDEEQLMAQEERLNLYYKLGYYYKKLKNYYEKGILRNKMSKYYNEDGLELIDEYFEEHNQTLFKAKK